MLAVIFFYSRNIIILKSLTRQHHMSHADKIQAGTAPARTPPCGNFSLNHRSQHGYGIRSRDPISKVSDKEAMEEMCLARTSISQTSTIGNILRSKHGAKSSVIASLSRQAVPQNRVRVPTTRERELFFGLYFPRKEGLGVVWEVGAPVSVILSNQWER